MSNVWKQSTKYRNDGHVDVNEISNINKEIENKLYLGYRWHVYITGLHTLQHDFYLKNQAMTDNLNKSIYSTKV